MYQIHSPAASGTIDIPSPQQLKKIKLQSVYHGIAEILQNIWLESVRKIGTAETTAPKTLFDGERENLATLIASAAEKDKKRILQFSNLLHSRAHQELIGPSSLPNSRAIDRYQEQMGQLIYLSDKDLGATAAKIDLGDLPHSRALLKEAFEADLAKVVALLEKREEMHEETGLQSGQQAYAVQKAIEIAKLLITSQGTLNRALIDCLRKHFFDPRRLLMPHDREMLQTLEELKQDEELQGQLQEIKAPNDPRLLSNDLIRIALHLNPKAVPTDQEARIVALGGLLSDLRQGNVGLAALSSIPLMSTLKLKKKILADFKQMLREGKLSRTQAEAEIVLDLADPALHKPVMTDISCKLYTEKRYLWDAPGLVAAGRQMGVENELLQSSIRRMIIDLYEKQGVEPSEKIEIQLAALILQIARDAAHERRLDEEQLNDLHWLGLFTYLSETTPCLLRAWESCLESTVNHKSVSTVHKKILESFATTLASYWPKKLFRWHYNQAVEKTQALFLNMAASRIWVSYDEQLLLTRYPEAFGAFILLEVSKGERITSVQKIVTPADFKELVLRIINTTAKVLPSSNVQERTIQIEALKNIQAYLERPDHDYYAFLNQLFRHYDPANCETAVPLKGWSKLQHLPFRDIVNENNYSLFHLVKKYHAKSEALKRPKNGMQLLEAFIQYGRKMAQNQEMERLHPASLRLSDPSAVDAVRHTHQSEKEWIEAYLIKPGEISHLVLPEKDRLRYADLAGKRLIPKELTELFQKEVSLIDQKIGGVHEFSQHLMHILQKLSMAADAERKSELSCALSNILLAEILPPYALTRLLDKAVKIAEVGQAPLSLVCFFDPVSNSVQLGVAEKNDQLRLRMLNEKEWAAYMPWETYGVVLPSLSIDHNVEIL